MFMLCSNSQASPKLTAASARGADGGRVEHRIASRDRDEMWELFILVGHDLFPKTGAHFSGACPKKSERQQHVHHLLAVARLLDVGDLAAAAIGDTALRAFGGMHGVGALVSRRARV